MASENKKSDEKKDESPPKRRRSRGRIALIVLVAIVLVLAVIRSFLPNAVQWYVNRTIDQDPRYDGQIGDVDIHLWRGAYSIEDIRLIKTTGNVPVPLYAARRVDLSLEWPSLLKGRVVGRIEMEGPELNFVDADDESQDQTGAGGPWLDIIQDLFPFQINTTHIIDGSIHFRAFQSDPPVDVYLSKVNGSIENLGNIDDETRVLNATVKATALAMDHAKVEYQMKLDPSSYRPTFQLAIRLLGLDVTQVNALTRAYGAFDFEQGRFDLVVELDAKEGRIEGLIKPLFRRLKVLSVRKDIPEDNVVRVFWEALVGLASEGLENQSRNQFGTAISLRGDLDDPKVSVIEILGNVLRNAFVRAYLPNLEGVAEVDGLQFSPGSLEDPISVGD